MSAPQISARPRRTWSAFASTPKTTWSAPPSAGCAFSNAMNRALDCVRTDAEVMKITTYVVTR